MELKKFDVSGSAEGPASEVRHYHRSNSWQKGVWMGLVVFLVVGLTILITFVITIVP